MKFSDIFPSWSLNRERARREVIQERTLAKSLQNLEASLPTFAKGRDETSWSNSEQEREPLGYDENDIFEMQSEAMAVSYRPSGRGLLETMESFVIGKEMAVLSQDESPEVQEYWDGWAELNNWDMRSKELLRRYLRDGEDFLRWFQPRPVEGQPDYEVVRFVEPTEIKQDTTTATFGIETDPNDIETVVRYHRSFGATGQTEWIEAKDMMHFKHGVDSNVKRGRSWLIGIAEYIRKHEEWLDLRIQLNRVRSLFAVIGKIEPAGSLTDMKGKFTDTISKTLSGEGTLKKMPRNALVLLNKGIEWQLQDLNLNATDAQYDGRNIQLLICAATGLPEYVVRGDASNANFASTMVSESPMVKVFEKYQDLMAAMVRQIHTRVIEYGISTGAIPAKSTRTIDDTDPPKTEPIDTITECEIQFPALIHRDIDKETQSLQTHVQNGWAANRTASSILGYDYEAEQQQIAKEDEVEMGKANDFDQNNF